MRIFTNADFISCEEPNRIFRNLVEEGGKIVFTGDHLPESYQSVKVVDLGGRCVVPAFGDTHMHFASFAYFNAGLDVRDVNNFEELGLAIRRHRQENPRKKALLGFGCSAHTLEEKKLPGRVDLDKMIDYPLMLVKYDGHAAVANSSLIVRLPPSVRDDVGFHEESGWLNGAAFYNGVNYMTRSVSAATVFTNMIAASDTLARRGISMVHSAEGVGFPLDLDVDILRFANRGLPQKFTVFFQTMDVKKVLRRKMPRIGGCFATALDGCFGSEDAALKEPYTHDPAGSGKLFYGWQELESFVKEANRKHLQVALHAIGDAAIDQALRVFASALKDYPRQDHRHSIIHADLMDTQAIDQAAELGICIALQPPFLEWRQEPIEYLEHILGDRVETLIPLKSMLEAGLVMAGGSDAPCTIPDPLASIRAACNHPVGGESIPVLDALRMHTIQAARLSFDEDRRGTLTPGKRADFVVLNRNPLDMAPERLGDLAVDDLYLEGKQFSGMADRGAIRLFLDSLRNACPD